jgi:PKD repeat protein
MKTKLLLTTVILAGIIISTTGCRKQPTACFKPSKTTIELGESVSFTNCSTNGERCLWSFGDTESSEEQNPKHVYAEAGTYKVELFIFSKNQKKEDVATVDISGILTPLFHCKLTPLS